MRIIQDIGRYILMLKGMFSKPENGKMYWKELGKQSLIHLKILNSMNLNIKHLILKPKADQMAN